MAAVDLSHGEKVGQIALPPEVAAETAVVVLGADRNLQHFGAEIDTVVPVQGGGVGIHVLQPFDGGGEEAAAVLQVGPGRRTQGGEGLRALDGEA